MNLDTATEQEVFDHVAKHLLTQGRKSVLPKWNGADDANYCRYKLGPLMCAAGCLLEPDQYSAAMESRSWSDLVRTKRVSAAHEPLISQLQRIHDQHTPEEWPVRLRMLASNRGLTTNF